MYVLPRLHDTVQSQHGLVRLEPINQGLYLERTDQEAKGSMLQTGARLLARQAVRLMSHSLLERVERQRLCPRGGLQLGAGWGS